ncbi:MULTISPECIES: class I SAM-dependent methyltransferase [Desulfosporosinus]|uniref:Methyltransferase domain-containing protein n=1 Tax=Desulfosporosinus lacus DSM 15449 TaxID=1121420 RepID=A0A1M5RXZ4_9FIRM|nr:MULTISPECIES: class I SAM-dependent methyltransferase [Desulfosporosinus]MDA8221042.1 class I SAM-dependent methyltransferase [Desulfitobacterium hafniense]SHH31232.1 Methyltransferase domain-containing protein [Desulfosporosinus lacus DSM 15449]
MKTSHGEIEDGVVVGNTYDKYGSRNRIVKVIMSGYDNALSELVRKTKPKDIHEIGCGEGYWVLRWHQENIKARGSDFSRKVINIARTNAVESGISDLLFEQFSIYDLIHDRDSADLIVCCEVLEHLEDPEAGMAALQRIAKNYIILSVPREPLWRILNLARGKYIAHLGNTPGHMQHWSKKSFLCLVNKYFNVLEVKNPLPWTMVLCRAKHIV